LRNDFLDISHWNDDPADWQELKRNGVKGIIFKVTESTGYKDPTYASRRQAARKAGLLTGGYHFLRPGNMATQATFFLETGEFEDDELVAIDHEDDEVKLDAMKQFASEIRKQWKGQIVLYSGHLIKEQIGMGPDEELAQLDLWLAQYGNTPEWPQHIWPDLWGWQFTGDGLGPEPHSVPGAPMTSEGTVDINELYGEWGRKAPGRPVADKPEAAHKTVVIKFNVPADFELEDLGLSVEVE